MDPDQTAPKVRSIAECSKGFLKEQSDLGPHSLLKRRLKVPAYDTQQMTFSRD